MADNTSPEAIIKLPVLEEKIDARVVAEPTKSSPALVPAPGPGSAPKDIVPMKLIALPLTIFSFILSLPVLFAFIWLLYTRSYDCEGLLNLPKLQAGIVAGLVIIFLASNVVVSLRTKIPPVVGLLLVMVPVAVMLVIGLGLIGAFNMETRTVPGSSRWLRMKVHNSDNWEDIKECIYDSRICTDLASRSYLFKSYDFTNKLSSIESGCCVPPTSCQMEYVNATYWKTGKTSTESSDSYDEDCDLWKNNEAILCYNCQACKDGFVSPLEFKWGKLGVFLIVMSILLILVHLILFVVSMLEKSGG